MKLIERLGYIEKNKIYTDIIKDLVSNGFTPVWYNLGLITDTVATITATKAILEAGPTVDPNYASQPWRICIDGTVTGGQFVVGTNLQLQDDGDLATFPAGRMIPAAQTTIDSKICGLIGHANTGEVGITSDTNLSAATPYSYRLCISNRGIAIELWQEVSSTSPIPQRPYPLVPSDAPPFDTTPTFPSSRNYAWVCVQRLVDPVTGQIYTANSSPVMALYSVDSSKSVWKIVVREKKVLAPTLSWTADKFTDYNGQVVNIEKQIVLTDTSKYYIIFPSGFNSHRNLYNEEMDLIAYTSAGVLAEGNDAIVNVYQQGSIPFVGGKVKPNTGDKITGSQGCSAVVSEVRVSSGDWATNDAAGTIVVFQLVGVFINSTPLYNANDNNSVFATVGSSTSQLLYRTYRGGNANINDTEGMRLLILSDEGGAA
jgi:hypothetical protein